MTTMKCVIICGLYYSEKNTNKQAFRRKNLKKEHKKTKKNKKEQKTVDNDHATFYHNRQRKTINILRPKGDMNYGYGMD